VTGVTQIDSNYLLTLKSTLETVLTEVDKQLTGQGMVPGPGGVMLDVLPLSRLTVQAGVAGSNGEGFDPAVQLIDALQAMGGSVTDQLKWLKQVLTDMIAEITTTVQSFGSSETLNSESVAQLNTDFSRTITVMGQGASSGSSPTGGTATPGSVPPGG
jgi:hypothetical protein